MPSDWVTMVQVKRNSRIRGFWLLVLSCFWMTGYSQGKEPDSGNPRNFEGLYIGVNTGMQSVFSEALINEQSVPQQDSRWTAEVLIAHRWQFLNDRIVFGLEVQVGLTDGDLARSFTGLRQLDISFTNNSQASLGYTMGYVSGVERKLLLYTYLYQIRRSFDVTLTEDGNVIEWQRDSQTAVRYGLGLEYNLGGQFSTRLGVGSQSLKINVEEATELTVGVTYQF